MNKMVYNAAGKRWTRCGFNASWSWQSRYWLMLGVLLAFAQLACASDAESGDAGANVPPSSPMSASNDGTGSEAAANATGAGAVTTSSTGAVPTTQIRPAPTVTSTIVSGAESAGAVGSPQPDRDRWQSNLPDFHQGLAPEWPFAGVVQLWRHDNTAHFYYAEDLFIDGSAAQWWLLYLGLDGSAGQHGRHMAVPLRGLTIECLGRVASVSHGADGLEVGGSAGVASGSVMIPWGEDALPVGESSAVPAAASSVPVNRLDGCCLACMVRLPYMYASQDDHQLGRRDGGGARRTRGP